MTPTRNNPGVAHENGSIESPHGHLKILARMAPPRLARHARFRHDGRDQASCKYGATPANETHDLDRASPPLIRTRHEVERADVFLDSIRAGWGR
jgi:hypothetical protein